MGYVKNLRPFKKRLRYAILQERTDACEEIQRGVRVVLR